MSTPNGMADRIRDLRAKHKLTLEQVAQAVGVGKSTVRKWETGMISNMRRDKIAALASALHTTPAYLMGWDEELPPNATPFTPSHRIPILGRIAAGMPITAEQNVEGYMYTELNGGAEYFALRVQGDSMNAARISDGDILVVRRQDSVENGQIAVVMVGDDEATVKRFYQSENVVTLMPQSMNPAHRPQIYDISKIPVRVIGLVVRIEINL